MTNNLNAIIYPPSNYLDSLSLRGNVSVPVQMYYCKGGAIIAMYEMYIHLFLQSQLKAEYFEIYNSTTVTNLPVMYNPFVGRLWCKDDALKDLNKLKSYLQEKMMGLKVSHQKELNLITAPYLDRLDLSESELRDYAYPLAQDQKKLDYEFQLEQLSYLNVDKIWKVIPSFEEIPPSALLVKTDYKMVSSGNSFLLELYLIEIDQLEYFETTLIQENTFFFDIPLNIYNKKYGAQEIQTSIENIFHGANSWKVSSLAELAFSLSVYGNISNLDYYKKYLPINEGDAIFEFNQIRVEPNPKKRIPNTYNSNIPRTNSILKWSQL